MARLHSACAVSAVSRSEVSMAIEFTRRRFMASAGGTAVASVAWPGALRKFPGEAPGHPAGREFFDYPQAAVVQSLGDIPAGLCFPGAGNGCDGSPPGRTIPSLPGMGIALGGVGAGSFIV